MMNEEVKALVAQLADAHTGTDLETQCWSAAELIRAISRDLAAAQARIAELEKKLALCELEIP